ncbi:alkyl/aryl-sulfatase [Rhodococcus ruber]|uniref:alkyl/aryl-sulfatase n=1 Tax=Rhodococcus ruber TaxID=1830 RepID=UPI00265E178B|nr:alkyl sulfatase dimerization domain-containing protein [Rhodococcus ruber]MDO1481608.1 MBL fold metallo-hydrolase [Rhodococcus ruber]
MNTEPKTASPATIAANRAVGTDLPFEDRSSFDDVRRGFLAALEPPVIHNAAGEVVWDLRPFEFLATEAPDTVNPSLWRMAQLNVHNHGLFRVADRIYQVRGLDVANMTVLEGDSGYVVIDPLLSTEAAAAGMELVRHHLGDRPVRAIVYTHSHSDHFGGVKALVSDDDVRRGTVRIIAPVGFMEHAVSENVYAGNAMARRTHYMYGVTLPAGARGAVSTGLGVSLSRGTTSLLAPTDLITESGQELVLDGIRMVFQYTPGAEAPAEMNFHLPQWRALCMAENVSHHMHNLYTLRGAEVRDAAAWADYIHEALETFGDETDVLFISHHWPVWGRDRVTEFLEQQRDLYRYIHDETLRLIAHGYTMVEIAERVELPESLSKVWSNRGYYGTLNHNVKAVYQKYLGWFDANPANLNPHEPVEAARRYVDFMGGADAVLAKARVSFDDGDYRWVAQVVNHVVFAEPDNHAARALQADALEQLGYQAESGPWRNFYLTGAKELRHGVPDSAVTAITPDVLAAMTSDMLLSYLGIRLNGPKAAQHSIDLLLTVTDTGEQRRVQTRNGVLVRSARISGTTPDTHVRMRRATLAELALGTITPAQAVTTNDIEIDGDSAELHRLLDLCDRFTLCFNIATP